MAYSITRQEQAKVFASILQGFGHSDALEGWLKLLCKYPGDVAPDQSRELCEKVSMMLCDESKAQMALPHLIEGVRVGLLWLQPLERDIVMKALDPRDGPSSDFLQKVLASMIKKANRWVEDPAVARRLMELLNDSVHSCDAMRVFLVSAPSGKLMKLVRGRGKAMIARGGTELVNLCTLLNELPIKLGIKHIFDPKVASTLSQSDNVTVLRCLARGMTHTTHTVDVDAMLFINVLESEPEGEQQQRGGLAIDLLSCIASLAVMQPQTVFLRIAEWLKDLNCNQQRNACVVLSQFDFARGLGEEAQALVPCLLALAAGAPSSVQEMASSVVVQLVHALPLQSLVAITDFDWQHVLQAVVTELEVKTQDLESSGDWIIEIVAPVEAALQVLVRAQRQLGKCDDQSWKQILSKIRGVLMRIRSDAPQGTSEVARSILQDLRCDAPRSCRSCQENPKTCFRCKGKAFDTCFKCEGEGFFMRQIACKCSGKGGTSVCTDCQGSGVKSERQDCQRCSGLGRWPCNRCNGEGRPYCRQCNKTSETDEPAAGVRIAPASSTEHAQLRKLWADRGGRGTVHEAWVVHNPRLAWIYNKRRRELAKRISRNPDELEGFHGSLQDNYLSIVTNGFDAGRRSGQAFGAGEYFAKNPEVSRDYARGGQYMLVCRLLLGINGQGAEADHIWAAGPQYYVVAQPTQVLPQYIIRFDSKPPQLCKTLQTALNGYNTLEEKQQSVPPNRPCVMSAESTNALWIGYLQPSESDKSLRLAVTRLVQQNLPDISVTAIKVQVVRGKFTQAKVRLAQTVTREQVLQLNEAPFYECGRQRTVTVDDARGSPGQKCFRSTARYCRGHNMRFVNPCNCDHSASPTEGALWDLKSLDLSSAKADEIMLKFKSTMPGAKVIAIKAIRNETLLGLHEHYRSYLRSKNNCEPTCLELYHGTNNSILDRIYTHGIHPPSDRKPSEKCPVSGGKGLCTSLCDTTCELCIERHTWCNCHMFGLGVYLADQAAKSHRYVSRPSGRHHRLVVCSVLTSNALQISGHLRTGSAMHDVDSLRSLWDGDLADMVEFVGPAPPLDKVEQQDLLFVQGLQGQARPGFSVVNSEYIAFNPYQIMPRYEIVYEV